jgi:Holliday junction resolvase RusA-like endonuclease
VARTRTRSPPEPPPTSPGAWTVEIPDFHPTSLNRFAGRHWSVRRRMKAADAEVVSLYVRHIARVPEARVRRRVTLAIVLGPRQRAGDDDNYRKSLLDSLVICGALVDDNRIWCEMSPIAFERGPRRMTRITLEDLP